MDRNLFGVPYRQFNDNQIRVVIDNPAVRAWFEQNARNNHIRERYLQDGSLRSKLMNLLRIASGVAGVGSAIKASLSNNQRSEQATPTRLRKGSVHTPDTEPMAKRQLFDDDEDMQDTEAAVAMTSGLRTGSGPGTVGGGETAIDVQRPWYGLPETATVILPWTGYFTAVTNNNQNVYNYYFRLNSPWDMFITTTNSATAGAAIGVGLYNTKPGTGSTWPASSVTYPTTLGAGVNTAEAPQWRDYWAKVYNKYAVLGCEYEMTFKNQHASRDHDVTVCNGIESLSAANGGRTFPGNVSAYLYEFWPGLKWTIVKSTNDGTSDGTYAVVKGYYKPGTVQTNVQNDEDIKTWTTVGATPTLTERMMVGVVQSAFNAETSSKALLCKLKLKYIVQFKDVTVNALYPASGQTAIAQNLPTDILTLV